MAWLPDFAALVGGDDVLGRLSDRGRVDDPIAGRIEGRQGLETYLRESADWLRERRGEIRFVASTAASPRVVGEYEVDLSDGDRRFTLPVAVVVEEPSRDVPVWIRIYHSLWPLLGRHRVRPQLLPGDPGVRESDVVDEYQAALATGDTGRIVATFEPDGCFREPAGPQYRVCGTESLIPFYTHFFDFGGGIVLEHCTVTEDGVRSALEFNAVRWGNVELLPQAGVAVYERGRTGRIADARVYDDVEGPAE
jgi:hypothetical protein